MIAPAAQLRERGCARWRNRFDSLRGVMMRLLLLLCLAPARRLRDRAAPRPPPPAYAWATFDRDGDHRVSGASGLADRARGRRLTIDDPVRIASITKLVVALGVMRLVEAGPARSRPRRLRLSRLAAAQPGLSGPADHAPAAALAPLLAARTTSIMRSRSARRCATALADPRRVRRRRIRRAAFFRYANLGFPVIASVMERASGERFDRLMERLVLRPLGLDACFNWTTCSDAAIGARGGALRRRTARCSATISAGGGRTARCSRPPGCDLAAYRARQQRRPLLAAGRASHLGARPRRRSAGCCSTRRHGGRCS